MLKSDLLHLLQQEIRRHNFDFFIENPPSIAQGGHGVCVSGCSACRKRMQTMNQFMDHLANDVLPKIIDGLSLMPKVANWPVRAIMRIEG